MSAEAANARADFDDQIEAIESGYEFLLAYAAQGRHTDKGSSPDRNVRTYLEKMEAALTDLASTARACAALRDPDLVNVAGAYFDAVETDAARAQALIRLVLAQDDIGSQLIDNLNASIHLRALLTDLFVADEALKPPSSSA